MLSSGFWGLTNLVVQLVYMVQCHQEKRRESIVYELLFLMQFFLLQSRICSNEFSSFFTFELKHMKLEGLFVQKKDVFFLCLCSLTYQHVWLFFLMTNTKSFKFFFCSIRITFEAFLYWRFIESRNLKPA
jgi:hypothetical protein